jgi:very-short-patch-repair endonuclease
MKFTDRSFVYGASPEIIKRAADLRKNLTESEIALWEKIGRNQVNGLRFKQQHPISKFIVDFYCHKALLVIEVDGAVHNNADVAEHDEGRQHELEKLGLTVLRFTNDEVLNDIDNVIEKIKRFPPLSLK